MTVDSDNDLENQIAEWRAYAPPPRAAQHRCRGAGRPSSQPDHRADRGGLRADEAFLIAVKRMGSLDELSREFAREHSERLWKQLVLPGSPTCPPPPVPVASCLSWCSCGHRGACDQGTGPVRP